MRAYLASLLLVPGPAHAQEAKSTCLSQHEHGQVSRREGHFDKARDSFSACTSDACPALVRKRCSELLSELDAAQPTVVIAVHDTEGQDVLHGVSMTLDDGPIGDVPATAVRIDPGEHLIRISTATVPPREHAIVVREGEKEKRIDIYLGDAPFPPEHLAFVAPSDAGATRVSTAVRVWGGISVVALLGAGATSAAGWAIHSHLASTCSPTCTASQVEPLRVVWPASFAALGIGVVTGAIAVTLLALHRAPSGRVGGFFAAPDGVGARF